MKKRTKLRRAVIKDSLSTGDVYNDGKYSGRVKEIGADSITIESEDEEGDVVDITIPIDDGVDGVKDPSTEDVVGEFVDNADYFKDVIESASEGNKVSYLEVQDDGTTVKAIISRPITQEEAQVIQAGGLFPEVDALNKAGLVTFHTDDIYPWIGDSNQEQQFYMNLLLNKKAVCPKTGTWTVNGKDVLCNGKKVTTLTKEVLSSIDNIEKAYKKVARVDDSVITDDEATRVIRDKNLDEILATGKTAIGFDTEFTTPEEVTAELQLQLENLAAPGEEVPELTFSVIDYDEDSEYLTIEVKVLDD